MEIDTPPTVSLYGMLAILFAVGVCGAALIKFVMGGYRNTDTHPDINDRRGDKKEKP